MKIKCDGNGGWQLLDPPEGARLRRIAINFVTPSSAAEDKQGEVGSSSMIVKLEMPDGSTKKFENVEVEWS